MNTGNLLQTKRIEYIDIAKGLGMILVVIGHSINGMSFPGLWIWSFHMPLFFILSGLCFTDNKYPTFIPFLKKRIKTLLLPSIYFSLLVAVLSFILLKRNIFPDLTVNLPGALWFVLVLFFTEIFYYPIFKFTKENKISRIIILISLLIFGLCLSREKIVLPFSLSSIPIASFYYGIGHSYKTLINKITTTHIIRFKIFISFLLLIIPAIVTFYSNKSINMNGNHFS